MGLGQREAARQVLLARHLLNALSLGFTVLYLDPRKALLVPSTSPTIGSSSTSSSGGVGGLLCLPPLLAATTGSDIAFALTPAASPGAGATSTGCIGYKEGSPAISSSPCTSSSLGLGVLLSRPTPAATRCLYDLSVHLWLKRKQGGDRFEEEEGAGKEGEAAEKLTAELKECLEAFGGKGMKIQAGDLLPSSSRAPPRRS